MKKDITALQANAILSGVRPRDMVGKTRKMLALEQLAEMVALDAKVKASTKELRVLVLERGSSLMDLTGVGPVVAARILADVGDVARFADRNRSASSTGTAPLDASSGEHVRHRLSQAGNRKANHVIHIAGACQIRLDTSGRAYYRRNFAAGKRHLEAMRCLKRRISDAIYRRLVADARAVVANDADAGPGGHRGASQESSAAVSNPHTGASDQPLPERAPTTLPVATTDRKRPPVKAPAAQFLTQRGAGKTRAEPAIAATSMKPAWAGLDVRVTSNVLYEGEHVIRCGIML